MEKELVGCVSLSKIISRLRRGLLVLLKSTFGGSVLHAVTETAESPKLHSNPTLTAYSNLTLSLPIVSNVTKGVWLSSRDCSHGLNT